jgi:hypothetical protein
VLVRVAHREREHVVWSRPAIASLRESHPGPRYVSSPRSVTAGSSGRPLRRAHARAARGAGTAWSSRPRPRSMRPRWSRRAAVQRVCISGWNDSARRSLRHMAIVQPPRRPAPRPASRAPGATPPPAEDGARTLHEMRIVRYGLGTRDKRTSPRSSPRSGLSEMNAGSALFV